MSPAVSKRVENERPSVPEVREGLPRAAPLDREAHLMQASCLLLSVSAVPNAKKAGSIDQAVRSVLPGAVKQVTCPTPGVAKAHR